MLRGSRPEASIHVECLPHDRRVRIHHADAPKRFTVSRGRVLGIVIDAACGDLARTRGTRRLHSRVNKNSIGEFVDAARLRGWHASTGVKRYVEENV